MSGLPTKIAIATLLLDTLAGGAGASEIDGVWIVQDKTAKVRIAPCGAALCARVVTIFQPNDPATGAPWLDKNNVDPAKRTRPMLGLTVASGMVPSGAGKWTGRVYSVDYGRDYSGSITQLGPTQLKIEGCQLMLCESETWTRSD